MSILHRLILTLVVVLAFVLPAFRVAPMAEAAPQPGPSGPPLFSLGAP
jgi:hypothetical protein